MRNDRVLIPVLHVAQKMLNVYRHVYTRIFIDNYRTTLFYHKNAKVWVV